MAIRILPHAAEHSAAVHDFNQRMRAGGSPWGFYTDPLPDWIPKRPGQRVWREYHLAVEDDGTVRGGFALKPQEWWIRGKTHIVTDWQGPFSEGAVDPKFGGLGLRMVRDMLKKQPLLYSWGHGGNERPVVQMIEKMGWTLHQTPLCVLFVKPGRFLRYNAWLRGTRARRAALDLLAFSGAGSVGIRAMHLALRVRHAVRLRAQAVEVESFGPWADDLWHACKGQYAALALRDADTMNALLPPGAWPPVVRLRIERDQRVIGWAALMDTRMQRDHRFGTLRVGSVVDCLASPADCADVVYAATQVLRRRGVDLVVSNQAHADWARGFAQNGYLVLQKRRLFAMSPALREALEPFDEAARGLHLTNLDGHGPMAL